MLTLGQRRADDAVAGMIPVLCIAWMGWRCKTNQVVHRIKDTNPVAYDKLLT
jgi:hypothetical protein